MGFSVLEKPATQSQGQYDGKDGTDDSRREWDIVADAPSTADQARAFSGSIARLGDIHPFNPAKICVDVDVKQRTPIVFDVVATYRVPTFAGKAKNPLEQVAKVTYDWAIAEEPIDKDADGDPIIMKTGESFDPPVHRQFGDLVVTVERNVRGFDAKAMGDLLFCTNSDTWLGLPPGSALLTKIQATQTINGDGSSYFTKTTSVQYRKPRRGDDPSKAWYWRQLAAGYMWILNGTMQQNLQGHAWSYDKVVRAWDHDGRDATKPVLHDPATGYPFISATNNKVVDFSPKRAKFYYFKIYESKPFSNAQIF